MAGFSARYNALDGVDVSPFVVDLTAHLSFQSLRDGLRFASAEHPEAATFSKSIRSFADCARFILAMGTAAFELPRLWPDAESTDFTEALTRVLETHRATIAAEYFRPALPAVPAPPIPQWNPPPPPMRAPAPAPQPPRPPAGAAVDPRVDQIAGDLAQVVAYVRSLPASPPAVSTAPDTALQHQMATLIASNADLQRTVAALAMHSGASRDSAASPVDFAASVCVSPVAWRDPKE
jgi:hypothetical protein